MPLRVIGNRQLLQILSMFMIVQFGGLLLATLVFNGGVYSQVRNVQVVSSAVGALFYLIYIVIVSTALIIIFRIYKGDKFFVIFEGAVVFISSFFVFLILFGAMDTATLFSLNGTGITANFAAAVGLALLLVVAKNKWRGLRNTAAIISSMGVGLVIGISFSFIVAFIFLAALAVYDFVAVFITKHMVTMYNAVSSRNLAFLIGVNEFEALPKGDFSKKELREYEGQYKTVLEDGTLSGLYKKGMVPVAARMELGTGDLAIPLVVAVAAYGVSLNFVLSFFIILGAMLGLLLNAQVLKWYRKILPAIPLLMAGMVTGFGLYTLLFSVLRL